MKVDRLKNSGLSVKTKKKSKGCCFSDGLDLLSFTRGKTTKWGQAVGKTGWQRGWRICTQWSNNVVSLLLKVMSFYEKWSTAREDFWQGIERRVPSLPSCCRAGENTEYYLHTEFRSQHMPYLFIEVLNRSPPFLIWQSILIHCFISDDANGIINGGFSQLTCCCERREQLYYSPVLCGDFLCYCKTGPLYNLPILINLSSFFILKAYWNNKESVFWTIWNNSGKSF